ncbi:MAG: EamA family transporter [Microgenomates group bacterium]
MSWQLLVGLSILLFSVNGLFHRVLMKDSKSDPSAQAFMFTTIVGLLGVIIAQFQGGLKGYPSLLQLPYLLLIAVLVTIGSVYAFKGFKYIEASEHTILLTSSKLWSLIGAVLFLGEEMTLRKLIAGLLILVGVMIAQWRKQKFVINAGAWYVLLSAASYGAGEILSFYVLRDFDSTTFLVYGSFLSAIIIWIMNPTIFSKLSFYANPKNLGNIITVSINDTLASLFLFNAYQVGRNAVQIGPLMATQTIVTVVLALIFLRETDSMTQKIIGSIVAVAGTILMIS